MTMLNKLDLQLDISPIVDQVRNLSFDKSLVLNYTTGTLLNGPYFTKQEFINTPLGMALEKIGNLGEARLLKLTSAESYTAHADPDDRIHVAITTNPYCYLIDLSNTKLYHIPADGSVWHMDTGFMHVAANFGGRERIHLNIRKALPAIQGEGVILSVEGGDFDWKQEAYATIMTFFNRAIKNKMITGFEKINERQVKLNCDIDILQPCIKELESKGFKVDIK
jgi:hypothetical protein